jgi:16S rRNA U1498 N3-methylase RsmE
MWETPPPLEPESVGLVGPSPGLSEEEIGLVVRAGFLPICLSDSRLRTETAAILWAGWSGARDRILPDMGSEPTEVP